MRNESRTMAGALLLSLMQELAASRPISTWPRPFHRWKGRVTATEAKNMIQDKQLADHAKDD